MRHLPLPVTGKDAKKIKTVVVQRSGSHRFIVRPGRDFLEAHPMFSFNKEESEAQRLERFLQRCRQVGRETSEAESRVSRRTDLTEYYNCTSGLSSTLTFSPLASEYIFYINFNSLEL